MVEKYIKDNKVAVLISPGFGAGWSTWVIDKDVSEQVLFDPELVQMVLDEKPFDELEEFVKNKYGEEIYTGGLRDIGVCWLYAGTKFIVVEYDGAESIQLLPDMKWIVA